MSEDLLSRFDGAESLTDIYVVARQLKAEGVDAFDVNDLIARARKRLVAKSSGIKRIEKIMIPFPDIPDVPVTQFYINLVNINKPSITIQENGAVSL